MGTNYYAKIPVDGICEHCECGPKKLELHVGKSSGGWAFSLHVIDNRYDVEDSPEVTALMPIDSLQKWSQVFDIDGVVIKNEYGVVLTKLEMLTRVKERGDISTLRRHGEGKYCRREPVLDASHDLCWGDFC